MERRIGGVFLALVLTFFAAAPSLDAFICQNDDAAFAAASSSTNTTHVSTGEDPGDHGALPESDGHCQHGHCHNVSSLAGSNVMDPGASFSIATRGPVPLERVAPAWSTFGQERPPRA